MSQPSMIKQLLVDESMPSIRAPSVDQIVQIPAQQMQNTGSLVTSRNNIFKHAQTQNLKAQNFQEKLSLNKNEKQQTIQVQSNRVQLTNFLNTDTKTLKKTQIYSDPLLQPIRRIQKIPYLHRTQTTQQLLVRIPTQQLQTRYYEIEHITQFYKKQVPQYRWQLEPREVVQYRKQYVPVDKKVTYLPQNGQIMIPTRDKPSDLHQYAQLLRHKSATQLPNTINTQTHTNTLTKQLPQQYRPMLNQRGQIIYRRIQHHPSPNPKTTTHIHHPKYVTTDTYNPSTKQTQRDHLQLQMQSLRQRQSLIPR